MDAATGAVTPPIHLSTTFRHGPAAERVAGYEYQREGNPTNDRLREAVAAMEGGATALTFASGMAAASNLLESLPAGARVAIPDDCYIGVRMLAAEELHREWAFTYRRETEDGAQLLQGVIDCCFIERGAWVLVDYKTDADAAGAIERHRPQLELYAQALAGITGRPVRERVLYLVRAGMGYQV